MKQNLRLRHLGIGTVGLLLLFPLLLIAALIGWVAFAEARKNYWDDKVREMCAKDGGVQVFEVQTLSAEAYESLRDKFGNIVIRPPQFSSKEAPIIMNTDDSAIRASDPEVRRTEYFAIRTVDKKILGKSVFYSRIGGDSFTLHPSSFGCPKDSKSLSEVVISKRGN